MKVARLIVCPCLCVCVCVEEASVSMSSSSPHKRSSLSCAQASVYTGALYSSPDESTPGDSGRSLRRSELRPGGGPGRLHPGLLFITLLATGFWDREERGHGACQCVWGGSDGGSDEVPAAAAD